MILKNHIANRILDDPEWCLESIRMIDPIAYDQVMNKVPESNGSFHWIKGEMTTSQDKMGFYHLCILLWPYNESVVQRAYLITATVMDKLDMLKLIPRKKIDGTEGFDWTVFKDIASGQRVFILPDNGGQHVLKLWVNEEMLYFCAFKFEFDEGSTNEGHCVHVLFYVNTETGEQCDHFNHIDVKTIEPMVYRLMCFFFLSENEEIVVMPGKKHGNRKDPLNLMNDLGVPVTIVNSKWHVTSIRLEGFDVSGHFRLQPIGTGRSRKRMIFIEPFQKHGYIRKARNKEI